LTTKQESKRAFFHAIVTEGDGKEKLEDFVNFCEDAIFEMQHADALMASHDEGATSHARQAAFQIPVDEEEKYKSIRCLLDPSIMSVFA
jgi:ryanodine receptor 2